MHLTIAAWDDRVFAIEIDGAETVETLKAILEVESALPAAQQQLLHHGNLLKSDQQLAAAGVSDGDMIMLVPPMAPQGGNQGGQQQPQQQQQQRNPFTELNADGSAKAPVAFIQQIKSNQELMGQLQHQNPSLAAAIRNEDVEALQKELRAIKQIQAEREDALRREEELLAADPFDPDAQRRIEEIIQQKNIEENMAAAMEHNPEVFAQVEMLYVDMEVNGVPVKTFVDSGAQMTIMTYDFADKCFLTRLIDKRFQGMAVGVGSSRIIGRIHQAPLKVGGHFVTSSITVLEQKDGPQFIFGLDMLRRHQCCIDLSRSVLHFGSCDATLPFLPDHLIPKDFRRHIEEVSKQQAEASMKEAKRDSSAAGDGQQAGTSQAGGTGGSGAADPMDATPSGPPSVAAATAPSAKAAAPAAAAGGVNAALEEKVERLMGLGFPREICMQALRQAGGNEEHAAALLFGDL